MTIRPRLEDQEYTDFRELIQERTGLRIGENRREVFARALRESAKQSDCKDLGHFRVILQAASTDSAPWDDLIKRLTIGETHFFRHPEQIEALRRHILPDLVARRWTERTLRLWSAGCATGEEPYTLAILLRRLLPDIGRWKVQLLATDINRQALANAAAGRFRDWSFRETNPESCADLFTRTGKGYLLDDAVRRMVSFSYLNLADGPYPSSANQTSHLDLILFRNVSIYLPYSVIHSIADRFYQCLQPGGWLMVGPSETNHEIYGRFQSLNFSGAVVYQKMGRLSAAPEQPGAERMRSIQTTHRPLDFAEAKRPSFPDHEPRRFLRDLKGDTPRPDPAADAGDAVPSAPPPDRNASGSEPETDAYRRGEAFMKQRRYREARESFLTHLARDDGSVPARYQMARLEANLGRLAEARQWAEQAVEKDPLRSEIHYTLALIHKEQEETDEAIRRLKKAIYLDPDFVLAHFTLFHLYERTGQRTVAERHRLLAMDLAARMSPDAVLAGSDDLTAGQLMAMARTDTGESPATAG